MTLCFSFLNGSRNFFRSRLSAEFCFPRRLSGFFGALVLRTNGLKVGGVEKSCCFRVCIGLYVRRHHSNSFDVLRVGGRKSKQFAFTVQVTDVLHFQTLCVLFLKWVLYDVVFLRNLPTDEETSGLDTCRKLEGKFNKSSLKVNIIARNGMLSRNLFELWCPLVTTIFCCEMIINAED